MLGRVDQGLDLIGQAKAMIERTNIEHDRPDVLRIEGRLHLRRGDAAAARQAFEAAMAAVDRMGAELFRARVMAGLAALD
jgi:hypothetical protein